PRARPRVVVPDPAAREPEDRGAGLLLPRQGRPVRRRNQAGLSRSELDLDHAFESAADPTFVLDPIADRFVAANAAGCALLGYAHEELLETPVSRIHPGELAQLQECVGTVLAAGPGTTAALTCRTRPGAYLPVEMSLAAFEHDGRTLLLGLVHDRSEHRQRRAD